MMNYKEYSFKHFAEEMREEFIMDNYVYHQPNENVFAYGNRFGHAFVWRYNEETKQIIINELVFPTPSLLTIEDFDMLREIAENRKWENGVRALNYLRERVGDEELDQEGISAYFYAWMAAYGYQPRLCNNFFENSQDLLTEEEFNQVQHYTTSDDDEVFEKFLAVALFDKSNGLPFDRQLTYTKKSLFNKILDFLTDIHLDEDEQKEVAPKIFDLVKDKNYVI